MLAADKLSSLFSPIEDLLRELTAGNMIILQDEKHRENEGDLVIAAEHITPEIVNFMRIYGSGVICLALSEQKCQQLDLPMMVSDNHAHQATPYTVSIDASSEVSTGISAKDRAHTLQLAASPQATPADFVRPGHIFPLKAHPQGVFGRTGHTEASVDLMQLAGLQPAAAIVEIVTPEGELARGATLAQFALKHALTMGCIEDLIAYRQQHESAS